MATIQNNAPNAIATVGISHFLAKDVLPDRVVKGVSHACSTYGLLNLGGRSSQIIRLCEGILLALS